MTTFLNLPDREIDYESNQGWVEGRKSGREHLSMMKREREGATSLGLYAFQRIRCHLARAFRSVVDRLLCMLKVKGSNPLMSMFFLSFLSLLFSDMLPINRARLERTIIGIIPYAYETIETKLYCLVDSCSARTVFKTKLLQTQL